MGHETEDCAGVECFVCKKRTSFGDASRVKLPSGAYGYVHKSHIHNSEDIVTDTAEEETPDTNTLSVA